MVASFRFAPLSYVFYLWLAGELSLQAMDSALPSDIYGSEICDLRQGEGEKKPEYYQKTDSFVGGTAKVKYTFCYQPSPKSMFSNRNRTDAPEEPQKQKSYVSVVNRSQVKTPFKWPYCVHGHLMMKFNNETSVGSGILVGPNHVLTAGHNIYSYKYSEKSRWATEVWFSPGREGKESLFNHYIKGCFLLCPKEWVHQKLKNGDKCDRNDYDFGMVILERAIGNEIGWSGLLCAPNTYFQEWNITVTGYPGEEGSNDYYSAAMWEGSSKPEIKTEKIDYKIPTSSGQSGGAIWRKWPIPTNSSSKSIVTIGVHTNGDEKRTKGSGVRLTERKFGQIIDWIKRHHLDGATDYSIPESTLLPLDQKEEPQTANDWWKLGKSYSDASDNDWAFICFYNAVFTAADKVTDGMLLELADCYREGRGTQQNYLEAFNLYMSIVNPTASRDVMGWIGTFYLKGFGVPKDISAGLHFLEEAVQKNNIEAIHTLYYFYAPAGESHDLEKTAMYRKKAADFGRPIPILAPAELNPNVRHWAKVEGEVLDNLYEAPSIDGLIESYPKRSSKSYLTLLWEQLYKNQHVTISSSSKAALSGMGGIGKTSIAAQYAHEALGHRAYKLIYWIASETEDKLKESYKTLLELLDAKVEKDSNLSKLLSLVNRHLSKQEPYLLIYDNVPDSRFLDHKIPTRKGHILMTSRCQEGWHNIINLDVFRPEDAVGYLFKSLNSGSCQIVVDEENKHLALQIAEELGYLPLALSHAASYIRYMRENIDRNYQFGDYLKSFKEQPTSHFENARAPFMEESKDCLEISHEYLVAKTLKMSGKHISDKAKELLRYFAYLDPDQIIIDPFLSFEKDKKEGVQKAIGQLAIFSLIKNNDPFFSIHRLVQLVVRQEQETAHLHELPLSFSTMLSSFAKYHTSMVETPFQNLTFSELEKWYRRGSTLISNLKTLYTYIQNLSEHTTLDKVEYLKLKFGTQGLQDLLNGTLGLLRKEIYKKLKEVKTEQSQKTLENITKDEIKEKQIVLSPEISKEIEEVLHNILSLELNSDNTIYIAESTAKIDREERSFFINSIQDLLSYKKYPHKLPVDLIKILRNNVAPCRCREFINIIQPLLPLDAHERSNMVSALSKIEPAWLKTFVDVIQPLIFHPEYGDKSSRIIEAFLKVEISQLYEFVNIVRPLLLPQISGWYQADIINDFSKVDFLQLCDFVDILRSLLTPQMKGEELAALATTLYEVGPSEFHEFLEVIPPLLTTKMDDHGRARVIGAFRKVHSSKRREFVDIIQPLLTFKMDGNLWADIIMIFRHMNCSQLRQFVKDIQFLLDYDMTEIERTEFMRALVDKKPVQRREFVEKIQSLLPPLMPSIYNYNRGEFNDRVFDRFEREMEEREREKREEEQFEWLIVIMALCKMELSELCRFVDIIKPLLTPQMGVPERAAFIEAFLKIEPEQRCEFVETVQALLLSTAYRYAWVHAINFLREMQPSQRWEFINIVKPLLTSDMTEEYDVDRVIKAIRQVVPEQRREFVNILHPLLDHIPEKNLRNDIIVYLASSIQARRRPEVCQNFMFFFNFFQREEAFQNQDRWLKEIIKEINKKKGYMGIINILEKIIDGLLPLEPELVPAVSRNTSVSRLELFPQRQNDKDNSLSFPIVGSNPKQIEQGKEKKKEEKFVNTTHTQNVIENSGEKDTLQLSDSGRRYKDISGLHLRSIPLNIIEEQPQKLYTIDGRRFRQQNVSGVSMRCFFNAVGLEADKEIKKLESKRDNPIVRSMIANEIVSAAANPEQLPRQVKEAIRYTLYEAQRDQLNWMQETRSDKLVAQNSDSNQQDPQQLPEVLRAVGEREEAILEELRQRCLSPEAFDAFLNYHIGGEQMMVALHDVHGNEGGNMNANYTSIDAVAYINNFGLKIYEPDGEKGLRLTHQFIPHNATEVVYLYHEGVHFQVLIPE
ncbi:NB-ARC domain-containing protein [Candidatus Odyssella acanthamoebae]|uniref:Serine protease n=1 Tax=Candidatus Odyssella acanthamoebae TaxID=91604 RepID=A0A077AV77_9PROT|nr:NB-ARC domain-containing protein [Candidatus Paracaedibacter acanthamoebae]AIK96311.1 hypothetical protein ID47_05525 [Candidatus Paracaedibacter acanthamoebae]